MASTSPLARTDVDDSAEARQILFAATSDVDRVDAGRIGGQLSGHLGSQAVAEVDDLEVDRLGHVGGDRRVAPAVGDDGHPAARRR